MSNFDLRWQLLLNLCECIHIELIYPIVLATSFVVFAISSLGNRGIHNHAGTHSRIARRFRLLLASDFTFACLLVAFLLAGRWPGFIADELNWDESQFLCGAQKLLDDPVYWRSVEAGSSGPLNVYPLMLPALFGYKPEYASARLVGLAAVAVSCLSLFLALRDVYGSRLARITLMPVATTFALMTSSDFVHYSSEHIPSAIVSVTLLLTCPLAVSNKIPSNRSLVLIGLLLGVAPYSKLQVTPICAAFGCICLHIIWTARTTNKQALGKSVVLVIGSILFSLLHYGYTIVYSVQNQFLDDYVLQNFSYIGMLHTSPLRRIEYVIEILDDPDIRELNRLMNLILLLGLPQLLIRNRSQSTKWIDTAARLSTVTRSTQTFILYGMVLLASSIYAVYQPGKPFHHYALFLIIPCGFLMGGILGELFCVAEDRQSGQGFSSPYARWVTAGISVICLLQVASATQVKNPYLARRFHFLKDYSSPVSRRILKFASPGDSMTIWGWSPRLHVETGVIQATANSVPFYAIFPNTRQRDFVKRFARDLQTSRAKLFVDSLNDSGSISDFLGLKAQHFELFPEISEIVTRDFLVVDRVDNVTIYCRKESPSINLP